ncbi:MAG: hypothetical protein JNN04_01275, partial [Cyclobacteriaceae bacterium]|nr:hypothetical protein [Cyclobacteriaceae bacterium]
IMEDYEFNWYAGAFPFTASAGSDQLNVPGATFAVNDKVLLSVSGGFPAGLSPGIEYFVKTSAGNDITLSLTMGGPTVDITGNGSGLISANQFSLVGDSSPAKGGEILSNVAPLPSAPVTAGSYWVIATKKTETAGGSTGGIGCTSAPFNITISPNVVTPQITLTPSGDTSCDPTFFEGRIEVDVVTASGPGNGGLYDYTWAPTGAGGQPVNSLANNGINNMQNGVNDGTYTLTATNTTTGCAATLQTTLVRDSPPVFTMSALATNLTNCTPFNGLINGIQVFEDGNPAVVADFDYVWYRTNISVDSLVLDGLNPVIPVDDQLSLGTFPGITLGRYFVKAVRKAGGAAVGAGCESVPIRRDILDERIYPNVTFATVASTSCDTNFDGQIIVTATTASGPGAGANYNFVWTSDPDGAGAAYFATNSPSNNTASPFSTLNTDRIGAIDETTPGTYALRVTNFVTGCFTDGSVDVLKTTIPMSVGAVTATDEDLCTGP